MPTSLMYHRYPYGSFAEYSEERIRGNRRGLLTNARVVGISRGNKEKDRRGYEPERFSLLRAVKCEGLREINKHRETSNRLLIASIERYLLSIVVNRYLLLIVKSLINVIVKNQEYFLCAQSRHIPPQYVYRFY